MKKLITGILLCSTLSVSAQTLFTYGKNAVSVKKFLKAYQKNNAGANNEKALREYLDLYISSRLKIQDAKASGLDTLPQIIADLANLRQQILPNYLNNKAGINKLVDEAIIRAQKDIKLAHLFISFKSGSIEDVNSANKRLAEVSAEIKKGTSFNKIAQEYSDDPSAKMNGGHIGWVTVFTLPYELENLAYTTPAGKTSTVYQSRNGFHILHNIEERKAAGRIKAAEILLAFPPDADDQAKAEHKLLADALYNRLQKGEDFGELATAYSHDLVSSAANGNMMEFGIGTYEPLFETAVYNLKEGEISKPILTSHGYHIIKLIKKLPLPAPTQEYKNQMLEKVEQSDRINSLQNSLAKHILSTTPVKENLVDKNQLWAFTDSILDTKKAAIPVKIKTGAAVLQIGNQKSITNEWFQFAQANRYKIDGSGSKTYGQLWNDFKQAKALDYYEANLEKFNPEFKEQMQEFEEGNLFFEVMQRKVWTPAQTDTVALLRYFEKNKNKYSWNQSVDAVVFTAPNESNAKHFIGHLSSPDAWRQAVSGHADVIADSSRFEWSQIPGNTKELFRAGALTTPVVKEDGTATFAYITKVHPEKQARSFAEARGIVINDYQAELESKWIAALKKKYPVVINKSVLNALISSKKF